MLSRKNLTDAVHDNSPIPYQGTQDKQVHLPKAKLPFQWFPALPMVHRMAEQDNQT